MKLISGNNKFIPTIKDCYIDTAKKRLVWEYVSDAKDSGYLTITIAGQIHLGTGQAHFLLNPYVLIG